MRTNDAPLVESSLAKLREMGLPMLYLHTDEDSAASAVLIDTDHFNKLCELIPPGEEVTNLVMQHEHIVAEDDHGA